MKDIASVLNKRKRSPSKGKRSVSPPKLSKRQKEGYESNSDSESDYYVEMDDDDFYDFDENDPDLDFVQGSNKSNVPNFDGSHSEEFLAFMRDFVNLYSSHSDKGNVPGLSHKSLRFAVDKDKSKSDGEKEGRAFSFGCMTNDSPSKKLKGERSLSHDSALIRSLKNDKASNKLAETFLQLAGLSNKDSSDLFKTANAKKSGEHRKASDSAPSPLSGRKNC